jgi:hypothetical protein
MRSALGPRGADRPVNQCRQDIVTADFDDIGTQPAQQASQFAQVAEHAVVSVARKTRPRNSVQHAGFERFLAA